MPVEVEGLLASTRARSAFAARAPPRASTSADSGSLSGAASSSGRGSDATVSSAGPILPSAAAESWEDAGLRGGVGEPAGAYRLVDGMIEKKKEGVDRVLLDHEARWSEMDADDASYPSAVKYLLRRINVERDLSPILDADDLRKLAYAIYRFRNRICEPDAQDLRFFAEQTGVAGSSAERWRSTNRSKWNK